MLYMRAAQVGGEGSGSRERERNKGGGLTKREFLMKNFSINPHLQREIIIIKGREAGKEKSRRGPGKLSLL